MIKLRFDKLAAVTGGTLYNTAQAAREFIGVVHDSRQVQPGSLFVAIRGERNDGHDFIDQALNAGAAGVIVEYSYPRTPHIAGDVPVIAVENSHEAMLALATAYRNMLSAKFVAITGSNGKTTTKELTYHLVHAAVAECFRSPGNLNNLYGLPLSMFAIPHDTKIAVMELGISTSIEMPRLAEIVRPDVTVVTNVGASHLEALGTVENVARAKLELVRRSAGGSVAVVNADDRLLLSETLKLRDNPITFGIDNPEASVRPEAIESNEHGGSSVIIDGYRFNLPMPGRFQIYNLLAAFAVFKSLGLSFERIDTAALVLSTAPMRGETMVRAGITFVVDCYNANPASMKAGIEAFAAGLPATRRVAVVGDMLELGRDSRKYHEEIGRLIAGKNFDLVVFVGNAARAMYKAAVDAGLSEKRSLYFESSQTAAEHLPELLHEGDRVYLKASRGIGLEAVLKPFNGERV